MLKAGATGISRLPQRWRTQRNAKCSVNCRIRESSDLWTQIALEGSPSSMFVSVCWLLSWTQLRLIIFREMRISNNGHSCDLLLMITLRSAPEIKQDHPLNLSISVSGGKETN